MQSPLSSALPSSLPISSSKLCQNHHSVDHHHCRWPNRKNLQVSFGRGFEMQHPTTKLSHYCTHHHHTTTTTTTTTMAMTCMKCTNKHPTTKDSPESDDWHHSQSRPHLCQSFPRTKIHHPHHRRQYCLCGFAFASDRLIIDQLVVNNNQVLRIIESVCVITTLIEC
jgi:hypothetical protein